MLSDVTLLRLVLLGLFIGPGLSLFANHAAAQDDLKSDSLATMNHQDVPLPVQIFPHQVVLGPETKSAALEFRNTSDSTQQADVQVQFAYWDGPHGLPFDTTVITKNSETLFPKDIVITHPGPADHFAGRWLSGVPTHVTLTPHQTQRVIVRITPPSDIQAGEYWARIVATVRLTDPRHPGGRDTRQRYALPMHGHTIAPHDTSLIIFDKKPLRMGLEIKPGAIARIDEAGIVEDLSLRMGTHCLYLRIPMHLTGNVPVRGMLHGEYRNVSTGEVVNPDRYPFFLAKDGVWHLAIETDVLEPGQWVYTMQIDNARPDIPPDQRIPMTPVRDSFPFVIKPAWAY